MNTFNWVIGEVGKPWVVTFGGTDDLTGITSLKAIIDVDGTPVERTMEILSVTQGRYRFTADDATTFAEEDDHDVRFKGTDASGNVKMWPSGRDRLRVETPT